MSHDEYTEEYEAEFDLEDSGYLEDYEDEDAFEKEYAALFDGDSGADEVEYERDPVTGRRAKKPRLSVLNQSQVSSNELDELFLEN